MDLGITMPRWRRPMSAVATALAALLVVLLAGYACLLGPIGPASAAAPDSDLGQVQQALDAYAIEHGAGQVQSWYVDAAAHQVVVTVGDQADEAARAFLARAEAFGDRVRVEHTGGTARGSALYGGEQLIGARACSVGFTARTPQGTVALTAGHCVRNSSYWYSYGRYLGSARSYSFPGNDFGTIGLADPAWWQPRPAVYLYNGKVRPITGTAPAGIGSTVCKSGATTGWTCGRITARNVTVVYDGREVVRGLTQTNLCVELGDSGGAVMSGNQAQGIVGSSQLYFAGGRYVCGQRVGRPNVAWFQPIGEVLRAYDARLTW